MSSAARILLALHDAAPTYRPDDRLPGEAHARFSTEMRDLALHLTEQLQSHEPAEFLRVVSVLEDLYASVPADEAAASLTACFLEDLIWAAEDHGVDLRSVYEPLKPQSQRAWLTAYRWTHDGDDWTTRTATGS